MNKYSLHQEVLIMTDTSFCSRQWLKVNDDEKGLTSSKKEQLMDACWNGLAAEMLPEFFDDIYHKIIRLWGITDANAFIDLEFGEFTQPKEFAYSINPYAFMRVKEYN
jgi:hypothetical protein